jgi:hypothetical protein
MFFHVLASVLVAAFFLQALLSSLKKSPVFDEPPHIASGLSYVQKGVFTPNAQHPPLLKELAAISLLVAGVGLPDDTATARMLAESPGQGVEWTVGNEVIAQNGPQKVLFRARLPLLVLSSVMGFAVYFWGSQMLGEAAGIFALFLFAFDPTLIAHSGLVTTDVGVAALMTLFFFSLWKLLQRPSKGRLLLTGMAMGLFLSAKFSAIVMIPVVPLLMYMARPARDSKGLSRPRRVAIQFGFMCLTAALTIMTVYRSLFGLRYYVEGLHSIYADASASYVAYLGGSFQARFTSYFAAAWALKEPLATIFCVLAGAGILLRSRRVDLTNKLFILVPPTVVFLSCTLWAGNIGVRYLIPALPFACLAGGRALAYLLEKQSKWSKGLLAALVLWICVAAAGIYPDHLSYFNEAACLFEDPGHIGFDGGTRCGPAWLDDSNVDWGQGLLQIQAWKKQYPNLQTFRLAYFGSFPPEAYGLVSARRLNFDSDPLPGTYAVSAEYVARAATSWLRTTTPDAIVGHAFYIYTIRPSIQ